MSNRLNVIIVTHNSEFVLSRCLEALQKQTVKPSNILVVDSASENTDYLKGHPAIHAGGNVGFCVANNIGYHYLPAAEYTLFLNPDVFLEPTFIEKAYTFMDAHPECAAFTPLMTTPQGTYDTTGIFSKWYGKWFDRGQGQFFSKDRFTKLEEVPAICGACFFARDSFLKKAMLANGDIFDGRFFMYKEDIDLSLRLKDVGGKLYFNPDIQAQHLRGWQSRQSMSKKFRLISARNEIRVNKRYVWKLPYSFLKWSAVKLLDI